MTTSKRLPIPISFWDGSNLQMPKIVSEAYVEELKLAGLFDRASQGISNKDLIGGESREETDKHFAGRFENSFTRVAAAFFDPGDCLEDVSLKVAGTFYSGRVLLLDLPCGSGASIAAVLGSIYELRFEKIVPSLELTLHVLGADYSERALEIFRAMVLRLIPALETVNVHVTVETRRTNALESGDVAVLCNRWLDGRSRDEYDHMVMIANFSGELSKTESRDKFDHSLRHIKDRTADRTRTVFWVEPLLEKDGKKIGQLWDRVGWKWRGLRWSFSFLSSIQSIILPSGLTVESCQFEKQYD